MRRMIKEVAGDRRAATAVEYGLILAMIVLAMIPALMGLAGTTTELWNKISDRVQNPR